MFDGIAEHEIAERDVFFNEILLILFNLFPFNDLINKC